MKEGKRRGGGKGWSREGGKVTEGMGRTGQGMGWDGGKAKGKEEGEGKPEEGLTAPKLQFLAPPLLIWTPFRKSWTAPESQLVPCYKHRFCTTF